MLLKPFLMLVTLACCECVYIYSSFWAPLFNPRILNYRVDIKYDPDSGRNAREEYQKKYGYRGENLIADLGNGRGLAKGQDQGNNDVKFYYTYAEATNAKKYNEKKN